MERVYDSVRPRTENAPEIQDDAEQWLVEEIRLATAVQGLFEALLEELERGQVRIEVVEDMLASQNSRLRFGHCRGFEGHYGAAGSKAENLEGGGALKPRRYRATAAAAALESKT